MVKKLLTAAHQKCCLLQLPSFLESVELADAPPDHFLSSWGLSVLVSNQSFSTKDIPLDYGTGHLYIKMETSLRPSFGTSHRGQRLWLVKCWLLMSLSQIPADVTIKAIHTRWNSVLKVAKKGKLWSPDFMMLPESRIKKKSSNMSCINDSHRHSTIQNAMNLRSSCTSETEITPPSEPHSEATVSIRATLYDI